MAEFDEKELAKLTKLCRIETTEDEKKTFLTGLKKILTHIEQLREINTEGVATCNHVLETVNNVMREDEVGEILSRELFLANAPSHVGGMVRVPPVIKFNN
ncbi:MAG TPA: Asp-tRNA(Asn)/Glu-tRNA(Gln) amidotransferase subunit GatC [Rhabdochlamydiaceae bacterium]|nr:Asp-tRNA(Asn)/Glu-tRNA(Gln) amidotransferase subunit GatC [Rhabdochlamydiaceae bacterium]